MQKNVIFGFLLFLFAVLPAGAKNTDIVNELAEHLKNANFREISRHFASTVEMIILSEEDIYSKAQAEIILKDFLSKHKPESAKVIHRLESNPSYRFAVIELKTENGHFRTTMSLNDTAGQFLITELRIELQKE